MYVCVSRLGYDVYCLGPIDELAQGQLQPGIHCVDTPQGTQSVHRVCAEVSHAYLIMFLVALLIDMHVHH